MRWSYTRLWGETDRPYRYQLWFGLKIVGIDQNIRSNSWRRTCLRKKRKKNPNLILELAILASPSMLRQLSKNDAWFVDATFMSYARGFYQILNIATYHEELKRLIPSAHVLMRHKNESGYCSRTKACKNPEWFRYKNGRENHKNLQRETIFNKGLVTFKDCDEEDSQFRLDVIMKKARTW